MVLQIATSIHVRSSMAGYIIFSKKKKAQTNISVKIPKRKWCNKTVFILYREHIQYRYNSICRLISVCSHRDIHAHAHEQQNRKKDSGFIRNIFKWFWLIRILICLSHKRNVCSLNWKLGKISSGQDIFSSTNVRVHFGWCFFFPFFRFNLLNVTL